jgi:hypothetical protein
MISYQLLLYFLVFAKFFTNRLYVLSLKNITCYNFATYFEKLLQKRFISCLPAEDRMYGWRAVKGLGVLNAVHGQWMMIPIMTQIPKTASKEKAFFVTCGSC